MATIKYIIQSKSEADPIYLRLSLNKNLSIKRKTGLTIDAKKWSSSTGLPKQNEATNKKLISDLRGLRKSIHDSLNDANSKGIETNGDWLSYQIDLCFKRVWTCNKKPDKKKRDYATNF